MLLILSLRRPLYDFQTFVAFLLWSYLWGVPGTLLAVPILATFKIFCDRIEPLKHIGSFLGRP
jgi:predicted PurR-regulated permease PerM